MIWISVVDGFPLPGEEVLTWNIDECGAEYAQMGSLDCDFVWISSYGFCLDDVKYWCPYATPGQE